MKDLPSQVCSSTFDNVPSAYNKDNSFLLITTMKCSIINKNFDSEYVDDNCGLRKVTNFRLKKC